MTAADPITENPFYRIQEKQTGTRTREKIG
jgi:hypothetical protein